LIVADKELSKISFRNIILGLERILAALEALPELSRFSFGS